MFQISRRGVAASAAAMIGKTSAISTAARRCSVVAGADQDHNISANPIAGAKDVVLPPPVVASSPTGAADANGENNSRKERKNAKDEIIRRRILLSRKVGPAAAKIMTPRLVAAAFSDYRSFAGQSPAVIREMICDYLAVYHISTRQLPPGQNRRHTQKLCGEVLSQVQLDALFNAFFVALENQSIPLVSAARVFRFEWPTQVLKYKRFTRSVILSRVSQAIIATQQQSTSPSSAKESANSTESLPVVGAVVPSVLSPKEAGSLLVSLSRGLRNNPSIIGSLANIVLNAPAVAGGQMEQQRPFVPSSRLIVQMMWAVHDSKTKAPSTFWHEAVSRLFAMHKAGQKNAKESPEKLASNDVRRVDDGEFVSPLATRSATGIKDEEAAPIAQQQSVLQKVQAEENKKRRKNTQPPSLVSADLAVSPDVVFRALRVLHLEGIKTDTSFQRILAEKALVLIGDNVSKLGIPKTSISTNLSIGAIARRIYTVSGLQKKEFLSLLHLAGELGIRFSSFADRFARELLQPLVRYLKSNSERELLLSMLSATECHDPEMVQVCIDAVVYQGSTRRQPQGATTEGNDGAVTNVEARQSYPLKSQQAIRHLLQVSLRLCNVVAQHNGLAARLQLGPFAEMLFHLIASEENTLLLRPPEMLRFVEQLHVLSRHYDADSTFTKSLRNVVDQFATTFAQHLEAGVLPLILANRLLEFSVILKMRPSQKSSTPNVVDTAASKVVAPAFPGVLRLLSLRNKSHALLESRGNESLLESYTGPPAVVRVFSEMLIALQTLTFEGSRAAAKYSELMDIPRLQQTLSKAGIVPSLAASVIIRDLYFQRSTRQSAIKMSGVFQRIVCSTLLQSLREAKGLAPAIDTTAQKEDGTAATAAGGAQLSKQQVLNILGMWPIVASLGSGKQVAAVSDAATLAMAIGDKKKKELPAKEIMASLWLLLKFSPLMPLKHRKELWELMRDVARVLGAQPEDVKKAEVLLAIAARKY